MAVNQSETTLTALVLALQAENARLRQELAKEGPRLCLSPNKTELQFADRRAYPFLLKLEPHDEYSIDYGSSVWHGEKFLHFSQCNFKGRHQQSIQWYKSLDAYGNCWMTIGEMYVFSERNPCSTQEALRLVDDLEAAVKEFISADRRDFTNMMQTFDEFIGKARDLYNT